jgi:hypothetical protein
MRTKSTHCSDNAVRTVAQAAKTTLFAAGNGANVRLIQMDKAAAGQFFQ